MLRIKMDRGNLRYLCNIQKTLIDPGVGGKLMVEIQVAFSVDVLLLELEMILREA